MKTIIERFHEGYELIPFSTCWWWKGASYANGYGRMNYNGRPAMTHRVSIAIHKDPTIIGDSKRYVCHKCDNPSCVNPDHLYIGDGSSNMRDAAIRGRIKNPSGRTKLTPEDVSIIKTRLIMGDRLCDIAKDYGVRSATIDKIRDRKNWSYIDPAPQVATL